MTKNTTRVVTRASDGTLRIKDYPSPDALLEFHTQIGIDDCSTDLAPARDAGLSRPDRTHARGKRRRALRVARSLRNADERVEQQQAPSPHTSQSTRVDADAAMSLVENDA